MSATTAPPPKQFALPEQWQTSGCKVLIIGCGGSGSEVFDAIVRLHYTLLECGHPEGLKLSLCDGDKVSPSNVGRQRFLHTDVGRNKAEVLAMRYGTLYGLDIQWYNRAITKSTLRQLRSFDLIITCVDRASFRMQLGEFYHCKTLETMWLDLGNGSHTGQVVLGHLGRVPKDEKPNRLPNVYDLYPSMALVDDDAEPSCSLPDALRKQRLGVNHFMAGTAVYTILGQLFMQGAIGWHGGFVDMSRPSVQPLKIDPGAWAFIRDGENVRLKAGLAKPLKRKRHVQAKVRSGGRPNAAAA